MSAVLALPSAHHALLVYITGYIGLAAAIAMIVLGIITAPERCRQAQFFARKQREAIEEWNAMGKKP